MKDFILELYSEEVPPLSQLKIVSDFKKLLSNSLVEANFDIKQEDINCYVTYKRLVVKIKSLKSTQTIPASTKIGPKVTASQKAVNGFLKSLNISDVNLLDKISKKNDLYYAYNIPELKQKTSEILIDILPKIFSNLALSWPRLMKWNIDNCDTQPYWIRPIRNILCLHGKDIIPIQFAGLTANNKTFFDIDDKEISLEDVNQYFDFLQEKKIILDHNKRKEEIFNQIDKILEKTDLKLADIRSSKIFDELTGLCESPKILMGNIPEDLMDLPDEILTLTLKSNQKYLCLRDSSSNLASKFIFVAQAPNCVDFKHIIKDNERVVVARLTDAKFFVEEDLKKPLFDRVNDLKEIVFHHKLGSMYEKAGRLNILTKFLSIFVPHCELSLAERLSFLCKVDLTTKAVGEFTDLQGKIGSFYAHRSGENDRVVAAIYEHYMPVSADSELPKTSLGVALAIADKIDTIVGLFLAGDKPTSSKDPFALRRSVLGIIRIGFYHNIAFPIKILIEKSLKSYPNKLIAKCLDDYQESSKGYDRQDLVRDIVIFFVDRLKAHLKENNDLHPQIVNAVVDHYISDIDTHRYCDILYLSKKIRFLDKIIFSEDKLHIISLYKRVAKILQIEEKKDGKKYSGRPSKITFKTRYEFVLYKSTKQISAKFSKLVYRSKFDEAFEIVRILEEPLNNFFDNVIVNDEDSRVRENRLLLLSVVRDLFEKIYGLSKIDIP